MKVCVTGSSGLLGGSILKRLDPELFDVVPIDLPDVDARDYQALLAATVGADALVHMAWKDLKKNVAGNTSDPANLKMVDNVYKAAVANGIRRLVMGSSNQAHGYSVFDPDGKIRPTTKPDKPEIKYGEEKLILEAEGQQLAAEHGIDVICLRIGNTNPEDKPWPTDDGKPQRWLSKDDLGRLVTACLTADAVPGHFEVIYGVSNGTGYEPVNSVGYVPLDSV